MNRRKSRWRRIGTSCVTTLLGLPIFLTAVPGALAGDPRDIVFECPCSAEWVAGDDGRGTLELTFGVRSFRATESGEIRVRPSTFTSGNWVDRHGSITVDRLMADGHTGRLARMSSRQGPRPSVDAPIEFLLLEPTNTTSVLYRVHEVLTLWPVPGADDADRIQYVDILTDTDGDGVGDVNERIAGTNPYDPASIPGESTVDILWLYDDGALHGTQYAKAHHLKAVVNALHADNGTNIHLRTVGIRRIERADSRGWPDREHLLQLMNRHGADLTHQISYTLRPCGLGCASGIGGGGRLGSWTHAESVAINDASALIVVHELGHVMGLAHSAQQGQAGGAFRWSRGHHLNRYPGRLGRGSPHAPMGTLMSYGHWMEWVFSNPDADCYGEPCGVPGTETEGADARRSLDVLRFQIAAHRDAKPDSDGDGFVDDADATPDDSREWMDSDGDGLGDNADPDDDGDGVEDAEDRWPLDPDEWEDLDGDGVGDNADDAVEVQGSLDPFRDAALRRAVEEALGKSAGDGISTEEMAGLQRLSVSADLGVRDLSGMELATGLRSLELSSNEVADLSPLAGLTNLEYLSVSNNPITDLSPLAGLTNLEELYLSRNPITDLSPVAGLTQLVRLLVHRAPLTDLSPLGELTSLEYLNISQCQISDLSPLSGLTNLKSLFLTSNRIADLSPLSGLTNLNSLILTYNRIADLSPLSGLTGLSELRLTSNRISDVSSLSGLSNLQILALDRNEISDVNPLSGLRSLQELLLTINGIADLSPLQGLNLLETLGLGSNHISDLSPLAGLTLLEDLRLDSNDITDLTPLASLSAIRRLWVDSNDVSDLSPLADLRIEDLHVGRTKVSLDDVVALPGFRNFRRLGIVGLEISDVRPLVALSGLELLSLEGNSVADISPLAVQKIWSNDYSVLFLDGNPLDEASLRDHIPLLESWGVEVIHGELRLGSSPAVNVPDTQLHSLVVQQTAGNDRYADVGIHTILTSNRMKALYTLYAFNAGVSDVTGLEAAVSLWSADLSSNSVSDLAPLSRLNRLQRLSLNDNLITDVSPLVGMDTLQLVYLGGNPLTEESLNEHIPQLRDDGVEVSVESVEWAISSSSETASFEVKRYFESLLGSDLSLEAAGDDSGLATVDIVNGALEVTPRGDSGVLTATVTATDGDGKSATLRFRIAMIFSADDHGNDRASATDLPIGGRIEARIEYQGDRDWFRLELSEPASLAVYTTGGSNTLGRLHDEHGALMVTDDDGGANANFHIEGERAAGVYYVRVESDGNGTGNYVLHARRYVDVALPRARGETVRLWMTPGGDWTLDPGTDAPFASGGMVASAAFHRDAYVLRLGSDGVWRASPSAGVCEADSWTISTFAGTRNSGDGGDGGPAMDAQLSGPTGVAVDAAGNVYVADGGNHRIRRIAPDGTITTFAGTGARGNGGDGGAAANAQLNGPSDVAVDAAGNVYVADRSNHRVRRIGTDGTIETIAGTGEAGYAGDGGPATAALLNYPRSMVVDAAGYVYIADWNNRRIRRVAPDGTIDTFAGTGEYGYGGDGGPAVQARISTPYGLAPVGGGRLYFTDHHNERVRRIDPDGTIETVRRHSRWRLQREWLARRDDFAQSAARSCDGLVRLPVLRRRSTHLADHARRDYRDDLGYGPRLSCCRHWQQSPGLSRRHRSGRLGATSLFRRPGQPSGACPDALRRPQRRSRVRNPAGARCAGDGPD